MQQDILLNYLKNDNFSQKLSINQGQVNDCIYKFLDLKSKE